MANRWDTLDKGVIHIPHGIDQDGSRFHHTTQNSAQLKIYELFISVIFHVVFSDRGLPQATETTERETTGQGRLPSYFQMHFS